MGKRTVGDWQAVQVKGEEHLTRSWSVLAMNGPKTKPVANYTDYNVKWRPGIVTHDRLTKADALLIAAAPEMLDALILLLQCFDRVDAENYADEIAVAQAAIAKAEGR